jgi:hypothetical protein
VAAPATPANASNATHQCINRSSRVAPSRRTASVRRLPGVLSVKKVLAGRGAVDYYLAKTRRGLADYYLPAGPLEDHREGRATVPYAPGSCWWGAGADVLGLDGAVEREAFTALYGAGTRPDGSRLGRRFGTTGDAAVARDLVALEDEDDVPPYDRWMAGHEARRTGG